MPRAKKKATEAAAPPSSTPVKKRKTATSTVNGNVNASPPVRSAGNSDTQGTKGGSRNNKT